MTKRQHNRRTTQYEIGPLKMALDNQSCSEI